MTDLQMANLISVISLFSIILINAENAMEDDASAGETSTACHASENDGTSLFREEHKEAILTICRHGCLTTTGVEHPISNKKCDWKVAERHCYFISCLKGSRREWGCTTWHGQEQCDAVNKMFGSECACHYGEQDESLPYFPDSHLQDEVSKKFTNS